MRKERNKGGKRRRGQNNPILLEIGGEREERERDRQLKRCTRLFNMNEEIVILIHHSNLLSKQKKDIFAKRCELY